MKQQDSFLVPAMTQDKKNHDGTKQRLINAAEMLIAQKGFDAVSVRDITGMAKANVAAINYHFGNQEGFYTAILEKNLEPIAQERHELLEKNMECRNSEKLLELWATPLTYITDITEQKLKLVGRCLEVVADGKHEKVKQLSTVVTLLFLGALKKCCDTEPEAQVQMKLNFAEGAMIHLLLHGGITDASSLTSALHTWSQSMSKIFAKNKDSHADARRGNSRSRKDHSEIRPVAQVVAAVMGGHDDETNHLQEDSSYRHYANNSDQGELFLL